MGNYSETSTLDTADTSVSTFGWDTAYIASFPVVNKAILAQKSYPDSFEFKDVTGITIQGKWKSWQLCPGGSGPDVQMQCIVETGTASGDGQSGVLDTASVVIQVNLQTVAAKDPVNDPTAKSSGTAQSLVVATSGKGLDPAVSIISSHYPDVISQLLQDVLDTVFKNYFNASIGQFNHVFAVMNLNEVADKDGFQWIKPTAFQYAVASPEDGSIENSAFGLIAMVQNNPIQPTMQQAVDVRALLNLPGNANSAFVISESMVAQNMLLGGAVATIQGSRASDFGFSTDGLSVTNVNDLVWGNFQTEHGVISPRIAKNNFTLRADDTYIYLEITNANYETSPGVTVHMNLTQKFTYSTVQAKNGNYVFIPDIKGFGNPTVTSNVSLSEGLQIAEIVMGAVAAVAGVLCAASAIGSALSAAADVAVDAGENTANIVLDAEEVETAAAENPEALAEENDAGADNADEGAEDPEDAAQVQKSGIFTSSKFRLAVGLTGAIAGAGSGAIGIAKAITAMDYDKIPAFDTFAANCIGASVWPGLADYKLVNASFRSSLVIGLAMDA
ncbi:TULIP family P47-like protein [uncultured Massilia sp.]|uniref:TULIP family P47-like protein n=1 Tax=uncultured Massilia sp. TaxID=169973 RepID=UPI0025F18263|nr:TULIP family P47-like protein [uncultured Massilia sp.]